MQSRTQYVVRFCKLGLDGEICSLSRIGRFCAAAFESFAILWGCRTFSQKCALVKYRLINMLSQINATGNYFQFCWSRFPLFKLERQLVYYTSNCIYIFDKNQNAYISYAISLPFFTQYPFSSNVTKSQKNRKIILNRPIAFCRFTIYNK